MNRAPVLCRRLSALHCQLHAAAGHDASATTAVGGSAAPPGVSWLAAAAVELAGTLPHTVGEVGRPSLGIETTDHTFHFPLNWADPSGRASRGRSIDNRAHCLQPNPLPTEE